MGSRPRSSITKEMRRTRRNLSGKTQRKSSSRVLNRRTTKESAPMKVSDKLVALNNLINPLQSNNEEVEIDKLFQETANYIVLLKIQVSILQKLVDFYGSSAHEQVQENQNVIV
ncbi:hypothetical protein LIER_38064 [Lithospermum erythrorhizon]|uniref:Uncharacterized protein n=1 Tax=Lithospermum erythrorhizon TaxID=34254 RepID=A0AAV3PWA9_LITER